MTPRSVRVWFSLAGLLVPLILVVIATGIYWSGYKAGIGGWDLGMVELLFHAGMLGLFGVGCALVGVLLAGGSD